MRATEYFPFMDKLCARNRRECLYCKEGTNCHGELKEVAGQHDPDAKISYCTVNERAVRFTYNRTVAEQAILFEKNRQDDLKHKVFSEFFINKAYHCDTDESIPRVDNEIVDFILEDIPYGQDYQSNYRTASPQFDKIHNDDSLSWLDEHFKNCHRILKQDRHIAIFIGSRFEEVKHKFEHYFDKVQMLIWDKGGATGMGDLKAEVSEKTEYILFGQKGRREWCGGKRPPNIFRYNLNRSDLSEHPTPKPIPLLIELIKNSTMPGEIVFDGYSGRGSAAIAAILAGRKFLVFEIKKQYYDLTVKNIDLTLKGETNLVNVKKKAAKGVVQAGLFDRPSSMF